MPIEWYYLYDKLNEIGDLTDSKFGNIRNYIKSTVTEKLSIVKTVVIVKYITKNAELKNALIMQHLKTIIISYNDFNMHSALLYSLILDFGEISAVAPDKVDKMKLNYCNSLKDLLLALADTIETEMKILENAFYSDETIKNDIHDMKVSIKNYAESNDDYDRTLVEFGVISVLVDLIKGYEIHSDIKKMYLEYKVEVDELFASADNVFKEYSVEKYDADSGVSFKNFMNGEPKFNIKTGELVSS